MPRGKVMRSGYLYRVEWEYEDEDRDEDDELRVFKASGHFVAADVQTAMVLANAWAQRSGCGKSLVFIDCSQRNSVDVEASEALCVELAELDKNHRHALIILLKGLERPAAAGALMRFWRAVEKAKEAT